MHTNNLSIAETYYTSFGNKNVTTMEKCLHPDVELISPLGNIIGKNAVLEAAKKSTALFNTITIRVKFSSHNQVMLVLDMDFPAPIGNLRSASLLTFENNLIRHIELFYDSHPFYKK